MDRIMRDFPGGLKMSVDAPPGLDQLGEATVACRLDAPRRARGLVSRWLHGRADAELRADACLLVSELVSNSILHADQPAGARLRITAAAFDGLVRIDVQDQGHGPVSRRAPNLREGGFGLYLVEAIAARWGVDHERGTRVWFELTTRGRPT
jgi:anti-sigma regulatory factor (Ser/Thr protein kinase)